MTDSPVEMSAESGAVESVLAQRVASSRRIVRRINIQGTLVLESPAHLGGNAAGAADMTILTDEATGKAMLTGATIAGALRSYLRTRTDGYRSAESRNGLGELLFGDRADGDQSMLIVDDAYGSTASFAVRDGVAIDPATRTAADKKKYDFEVIEAGTTFPLRFELLLVEGSEVDLMTALAASLEGLETGEIPFGMRRRRGLGRCRVDEWMYKDFAVSEPEGLLEWLAYDSDNSSTQFAPLTSILNLPNLVKFGKDVRRHLDVDAVFSLDGSMLIRSGSDEATGPDAVHLTARRGGAAVPIVSGTAIAGALRSRARRIINALGGGSASAKIVDDLFGVEMNGNIQPVASRLTVHESEITNPIHKVVSRLKIDRFTGGAYPGALFSEQPVYGSEDTKIRVHIRVENPHKRDVGLVMLLLKDLWTGDLAIGGESSVGRGRLKGRHAKIRLAHVPEDWFDESAPTNLSAIEYDLAAEPDLSADERKQLELCCAALIAEINKMKEVEA